MKHGIIVSAEYNKTARDKLLSELMALPNMAWTAIIQQAGQDPELLSNTETVKIIANIIKTNVAVCKALGPGFYSQWVDYMLICYHYIKLFHK